jgi:glycosyltransferase involved in cell wall biosynthesis
MDLPKITVVVPSYNQGHFLGEALASIVDQNYPGLELIVMDGGSTDGSVEVIRRYEPFISYWQSRPDGGQSAAINEGMKRATGDIVAWLNSDDMLCPGSLAVVGGAASRHPGFGLYIGNGFRLDQATQTQRPFYPGAVALNRQALRNGVNYILQPSVFFSRVAWVGTS